MKNVKKLVAMLLATTATMSMVACGGNDGEGENVCEIKALISGYDVTWLDAAATAFNTAFKDEGYEVKITLKDSSINASQEILSPKRNTTDLYFEGNNINTLIEKSRSVLGSKGGALLEDLSDVLDGKAINAQGKEEGDTIRSRLDEKILAMCKYTGTLSGFDGYYGLPMGKSATGIYVNKKVLTQKGYSTDDLLTTDGLLKVVEELAPANPLDETQFFPVAWSGLKAPGYWDYLAQVLFAQYTGLENYDNFWDFIPATGTQEDNGYTVYSDQGILETLNVVEELENTDYAVPGTSSMDHIGAQARVFTGNSLLVVSGDWVYKEMEKDFGQYLNDVIPIKTPILSALGVKLGLCGSEHTEVENQVMESCANCESALKAIVKDIDGNTLTNEEIVANHTGASVEDVQIIRERRGYYLDQSGISIAIPSYANAKDVAKKFIRFLYSTDGAEIYQKNTHEWLYVKEIEKADTSALSEIDRLIYEKKNLDSSIGLRMDTSNVMRSQNTGMGLSPEYGSPLIYSNLAYSHSTNSNPSVTAEGAFEAGKRKAKNNWQDWLANAGLNQR